MNVKSDFRRLEGRNMHQIFLLVCAVGVFGQLGHSNSCHRSCTHHHSSVCGTDGKTYTNQCVLEIAKCNAAKHNKPLELAHVGGCTSIDHPTDHCDHLCIDEEGQSVVCGSDGVTYPSNCDFSNGVCKAKRYHHHHLTVAHSGECLNLNSTCEHANTHCGSSSHYICATNGYTYMNECSLKQAMCHRTTANGTAIGYLHAGRCHEASTNLSRAVDCSQYADMSLAGVAVEGMSVLLNPCPHTTHSSGHSSHSGIDTHVCSDHGITFTSECSLCSRMAQSYKISYSAMTVPISYDGRCHHNPIIG